MTASDPRVGEIQARLHAATPGPWFQGRESRLHESEKEVYSEREPSPTSEDICSAWHPEDAEFIAAAPADVAYLLAELRDRDEKLAKVAELHAEDVFRGHLSNGCKTCGNGEHGYPCPTIAAVAAAGGESE